MAAIVWMAFSRGWLALAIAGAAVGFAATIRPGSLLALLVVVAWAMRRERLDPVIGQRQVVIVLITAAAVPIGVAAAYLISVGALAEFLDVAWQYWPLYARMDGSVWSVPSPLDALRQWAWTFVTHPAARWIPAAVVGFWLAWPRSEDVDRDRLLLLAGLGAAFAINAGLVGHFAAQHWLPLTSITVPLACLSLMRPCGVDLDRIGAAALALTILTMGLTLKPPDEFLRLWSLRRAASAEHLDFLRVTETLRANGGPALRVQPIGWAWADASLMSGAQPATSFVSDVPFIHHQSHPYIRSLQERFLAEFDAHPPDVIVCPLLPRQPIAEADLRDYPWLVTRLHSYRPFHRTQFFILYARAAP
jgi:hypothetical protein